MNQTAKIAVVGAAGGIGSAVAYTLALRGLASELLLVDPNAAVLETQLMDLEQLRGSVPPFEVRVAAPDEIPAADVVVISAAVPAEPDLPRMAYLSRNLGIMRQISRAFEGVDGWPGIVLMASNPVDPLLLDFQVRTGIDRRRVLGYSINDTLRFRYGIALELGLTPDRVRATVIGEHGSMCVPLYSGIEIDGVPTVLDEAQRERVRDYVLGWYPRWVALGVSRTSTWTSGHHIALMIDAILHERDDPWPASFVLEGEYGLSGIALSLPVRLGSAGVREVLDWPLTPDEREALDRAAEYLASIDPVTA